MGGAGRGGQKYKTKEPSSLRISSLVVRPAGFRLTVTELGPEISNARLCPFVRIVTVTIRTPFGVRRVVKFSSGWKWLSSREHVPSRCSRLTATPCSSFVSQRQKDSQSISEPAVGIAGIMAVGSIPLLLSGIAVMLFITSASVTVRLWVSQER